MRLSKTALGAALVLAAIPATAMAQAAAPERTVNVSRPATKAVAELQAAVNANDLASIPAKVAAAQAAARTPDDRYVIGSLQLKAAVAAKDNAAIAAALEAMIASGFATPSDLPLLHLNLAKTYRNLQQLDRAATSLEQVVRLEPSNVDAVLLLAEIRNTQGQVPVAVGLIQKAIAAETAKGGKAKQDWYKRALGLAFNAKLPASVGLSRDWVQAYPDRGNWRDALRIYRRLQSPDQQMTLDLFRLARATGALEGKADFFEYGDLAYRKGYAGEAKAALDEGLAARQFDRNEAGFKELVIITNVRSRDDRATVLATAARAAASASAPSVVASADALYGYGEYAKAAELYRAALGKSGADANLINLRLGAALARAGDKAAATAAFNAVTGPRAELAKFWLVHLSTSG